MIMNDADKNRSPRAVLVLDKKETWWWASVDAKKKRKGPFTDAAAARSAMKEAGFVEAGFIQE